MGFLGCLEFNLRGHAFPGWSSAESRRAVAQELLAMLLKMRRRKWAFTAEMAQLSQAERLLLLERAQITGAMAARQDGVHVLINDRQDTECYINDEEHFLLKAFFPGEEGLRAAQAELGRLLADFGKKLPIAHDAVFGYLSCDPAKGGEALFFSCLLHLPALKLARHMLCAQSALDEMGVFLSPIFTTEQKVDPGDMYLLHSPAAATGKLDAALKTMELANSAICTQELHAREKLLEQPRQAARVRSLLDRAYHLLTRSDKLKYRDLLSSLSLLRLGLSCGILRAEAGSDETAALLNRAYYQNAPLHMTHALGLTRQSERLQTRARCARELVLDQLRLYFPDSQN